MKKNYLLILIFLLIFFISLILCFIPHSGNIAVIKSNGKTIKKINLEKVEHPYTFTVEFEGRKNTVYVEHGCISVSDSDCPDKICVNTGKISDSSVPIVCLPNRLSVSVIKSSDTDAVSG